MTRDAHAIFWMKTVGLSNDECAVQAARAHAHIVSTSRHHSSAVGLQTLGAL